MLYQWLVGFDYAFTLTGLGLCIVNWVYSMFPAASNSRGGRWILRIICWIHVVSSIMVLGFVVVQHANPAITLDELNFNRTLRSSFLTVTAVLAILEYIIVISYVYRQIFKIKWNRKEIIYRGRFVMGLCVLVLFGTQIENLQIAIGQIIHGHNSILVAIIPLILSKLLLLILRNMIRIDDNSRMTMTLVSLSLNSYTSVSTRRLFLEISESNYAVIFLTSCAMGCCEIFARTCITISHCHWVSHYMKLETINTKTLDGLLNVYTDVVTRSDLFYSQLFTDQFVEIFVILMIAGQDLCQPVWTQYRVWDSAERYAHRARFICAAVSVQLSIGIFLDWTILRKFWGLHLKSLSECF